jgi:hypothetical protein
MKKITTTELKQMIKEEFQKQLVKESKQSLKEGKFTVKRLIDIMKKYKRDEILVFANNKEYAVYNDEINPKEDSVFGVEHHGKEKEIDVKDIEFVTINGKRIS